MEKMNLAAKHSAKTKKSTLRNTRKGNCFLVHDPGSVIREHDFFETVKICIILDRKIGDVILKNKKFPRSMLNIQIYIKNPKINLQIDGHFFKLKAFFCYKKSHLMSFESHE